MAGVTYRRAGVNIDAADLFIRSIKPLVRRTGRPEVMGTIGGFSGLFAPRTRGMKKPLLVASTDGVGTKLMLADYLKKYDTVGVDLVAMSVDDVVVLGAEPLFFLDYIAIGKLRTGLLVEVMKGIVRGCREARCALLGGETAELPGLYASGQWDLAGFCVGLVDAARVIDGRSVRRGDALVGLASSGLHSNGFSLARKVFSERDLRGPIGRELLRPTKIYCSRILDVMKTVRIKAMAHITGGGFYDNIPRVIPSGLGVRIEKGSWAIPPIFGKIQARGRVDDREMYRTLNMGVGMALVVADAEADRCVAEFRRRGQRAWLIGDVAAGPAGVRIL
jgi:phosphoribosylformylglycinamidine cyclo-ligase